MFDCSHKFFFWCQFSSYEKANEVEEFFASRSKPKITRTLKQSLERVHINAKWVQSIQTEKHLAEAVQELACREYQETLLFGCLTFIWLVRCMFKAIFVFQTLLLWGLKMSCFVVCYMIMELFMGCQIFLVFRWNCENDSCGLSHT